MFTWQFEIALVVAAFILGTLEGHRLLTWLKSFFVSKVTAIETKVAPPGPVGITGQTGPHA